MTIAHIFNGELGFDVRTKLNALIDYNNGSPGSPTSLGDVFGPAGAINNRVAVYDGTTGKLIKDGGQTIADIIAAGGGSVTIGGAITGATAGSVLFAGPAGILAQDNAKFFWDDTNFVLKAGKRLQQDVNGTFVNALFPVYGGVTFANSWFVGQSGNTTLTGYNNTGVGFGPMIIASTGHDNTAVGTFALNVLTTSSFNTAVGVDALGELDFPGSTGGDYNSAFGVSSLHALEYGTGNTAIGNRAGNKIGRVIQSDNNTMVGMEAYWTPASGNNNTVVGYRGGYNIAFGSNNTLLGCWNGPSSGLSSVIALSDGAGSLFLDYNYTNSGKWTTPAPLVFMGSSSGAVTVAAAAAAGTWTMTLPTSAGTNTYMLQTDGSGVTSWVAPGAGGGGMAIGGAVGSGTTGSVLFVDGSGNLGQDNANFFWDDTGNILKLAAELDFQGTTATFKINTANKLDYGITVAGKWTSADAFNLASTNDSYFIQNIAGLYVVPHGSGNNWFEAGAGNRTLTGYNNFGTGDLCLQAITTGHDNVGVGSAALYSMGSGVGNVAVGANAMGASATVNNNFAFGYFTMHDLTSGNSNVAIGDQALLHMQTGSQNICIGPSALGSVSAGTANQNTIVGASAGSSLGSGAAAISLNTLIGANCGANISGGSSQNTWIGPVPGRSATYSNTIAISDGQYYLLDIDFTTSQTWSMSIFGAPCGLHVYNTTDGSTTIAQANWERGIFDWHIQSNVLVVGTQANNTGVKRLVAIDGFAKAGAPAAGDLPSGSFAVIDDTSGGQTWLVFNKAGTIRKVQLV